MWTAGAPSGSTRRPPAPVGASGAAAGPPRSDGELVRIPLEYSGTAHSALSALRALPYPFALTGRWAGGGAVVGASPTHVLPPGADPFSALDRLPRLRGVPAGAVGGGWFGYLGYGLGARVESLPARPPRPAPLPDCHLAYYDHVVRQDADGRWWLEGIRAGADAGRLEGRMQATRARLAEALEPPRQAGPRLAFAVAPPGHAGHRWAVAEAVERIAAGDLFQVNLGLRLEAVAHVDPVELFARAAPATEPAYGAVFATEWGGVVSLSPELFLRRRGRHVVTGPIKGTVARAAGAAVPDDQRDVLLASAKDAAEHVMIVDLMRNDLGRVCEYGSVTREQLRRVEPHPGVWHLVSDVSGTLRPGCGDGDLVRASFPPGSVTGAPKVQSLRLIAELEGTGRELYTGALGFASPAAGLELSVAIRTFELARDRIWLGAGGGIVADSLPHAELEEALAKAAPLVAAAGGSIEPERAPRRPIPARFAARAGRPDPTLGLFETVRVLGGSPLHLDDHLRRLSASVRAVYGAPLPTGVRAQAIECAARAGDARLRILVAPDGRSVAWSCETAPLPAAARAAQLWPVVLPGGLGAHKWRDRRLLDELSARAEGAVPLLVDSSGEVLEAAWANVWVVLADEHLTPPADGRLLAGVTRALRLDRLARDGVAFRVTALGLDDLARGEVYLTSSLRGVTRARLGAGRRSV